MIADPQGGMVFWAPTPDRRYHIIEDASVEKKRSLCNLVLDVAEEQIVVEIGDKGPECRSCIEAAHTKGYRGLGGAAIKYINQLRREGRW